MEKPFVQYPIFFAVAGKKKTEVSIRIYRPIKTEYSDYSCKYVISGLTKSFEKSAVGIDEIQALGLALNLVKSCVINSVEYKAGKLIDCEGSTALFLLSTSLDEIRRNG
ncbi:MAG: hypothetical protein ACI861_000443 [Paracoccaceae bacterium]|jgi:hypothetical protein